MTHQDEFDLLCFVLRHADQGEAALASFRGPSSFRYLHTMGYVTQHPASGRFSLTNQGRERLAFLQDLLERQSREDEAHQQTLRLERKRVRKDARRSWWQLILSLLLGWLLGWFTPGNAYQFVSSLIAHFK